MDLQARDHHLHGENAIGTQKQTSPQPSRASRLKWVNLLFTLGAGSWGIWYLAQRITLADITTALSAANGRFLLLALLITFTTVLLKAWRWQLMLSPHPPTPPFPITFWALITGQFINTTIPLPRLGDLARVYTLDKQANVSKMRALGTLIVEKTLDLIMLTLTLAIVLPSIVLPTAITRNSLPILITAVLLTVLTLYLITFQTQRITTLLQKGATFLPQSVAKRFLRWTVSGLEGLDALRSPALTIALLALSLLIAFLSILTPFILFRAFAIPLQLIHGGLLHVSAAIIAAPSTTPAQIGFFEFAVYLALKQLGITQEALIVSFALAYHLIAIAPQILLGFPALIQSNWRRQTFVQLQQSITLSSSNESTI